MRTFTTRLWLNHPVEEVFDWHTRPGALRRQLPPWEGLRLVTEAPSLRVGAEAVFRPPGPARFTPRWVARHTAYHRPDEFVDEMPAGPLPRWRHRHRFQSTGDGGTTLIDEVSYELPLGRVGALGAPLLESRLRRGFTYRHTQLTDDLAAHAAAAGAGRLTVAVTGAGGLIGGALTAFLESGGHRVIRLVRRPPRHDGEAMWDPARDLIEADALRDVDAVVHLAGRPLAGRWTARHRHEVRRSRIAGTRLLARTLAGLAAAGSGPRVLVSGSAIGYYGAEHGDETLDETAPAGHDALAELCREWEDATFPAREAGLRVVLLRTGIVQSPAGGALRLQLPLFLAGAGGRLGAGTQWLSWISIDDAIGIIHHALTRDTVAGPVNVVAPDPVRGSEYAATLARVLHRPALLPTPALGPRLLLTDEGARLTALASQRVTPAVADSAGYRFRQPDLETALRHVLGRTERD